MLKSAETPYGIIGKVKVVEIPEANTLNMAHYNGLPYAVSKDVNEDDLYVIFFPDGRLSEEYATANDLVQHRDEVTGKQSGGFFAKNRKVRAVSFMQGKIKSVGYLASLDSLEKVGVDISQLVEGDEFNELQGIKICEKFVSKATKNAKQQTRKSRDLVGFDQHQDTKQWYLNLDYIQPGDTVTLTEKMDGTSNRFGKAYENIERSAFKQWVLKSLWKFFGFTENTKIFDVVEVVGTRKVVLNTAIKRDTSFYNDDTLYTTVFDKVKEMLHPGESIFGEIVGWNSPEKALFDRGGVKFTYGTQPGERDFYVYAIKHTFVDGTSRHISWEEVKERSELLGLKHVPEFQTMRMSEDPLLFGAAMEYLKDTIIPSFTDGKTTIAGANHIREGCAIRVDRGSTTKFLKSKSADFYALEDKFKADETNVDIEEIG